jgi:hypothetical protein
MNERWAGDGAAPETDLKLGLAGTWRLALFRVRHEEGTEVFPFGRDAVGFATYTADGFMSAQVGRADRSPLAGVDWSAAPDAAIAAAARGYVTYCGPWELRGETVAHRVTQSLVPDWVGGEQVRRVELAGDALTLTAPPVAVGERRLTIVVEWRRA